MNPVQHTTRALQHLPEWSGLFAALADEVGDRRIANRLRIVSKKLSTVTDVALLASDPSTAAVMHLVVHPIQFTANSHEDLVRVVDQLDAQQSPWSMWLYPAVVSLLLLAVLLLASVLIVPIYESMFNDFGSRLPYSTKVLLGLNKWIFSEFGSTLMAAGLCAIPTVFVVKLWRNYGLTHRLTPWLTAGRYQNVKAMAILTQNFAELLALGFAAAESLRLVARGCSHPVIRQAVLSAAEEVESGKPIGNSGSSRVLPQLLIRGLALPTASQVELFRCLGQLYRDRWLPRPGKMVAVIGPLLIILLGVLVLLVVLAVFLPLLNLITELG
ncbi:MAG: type II secretion system F family protein [Pirellulaceae bacterium]|nr:type II secretion system F family protein [Pirellulaceae bacterium]